MPSSVSNDDVGVGEGIAFWRATIVAVAKDVSMEEGEPASSRECSEELCSEELCSKELSSKECSEERGPGMEEGRGPEMEEGGPKGRPEE